MNIIIILLILLILLFTFSYMKSKRTKEGFHSEMDEKELTELTYDTTLKKWISKKGDVNGIWEIERNGVKEIWEKDLNLSNVVETEVDLKYTPKSKGYLSDKSLIYTHSHPKKNTLNMNEFRSISKQPKSKLITDSLLNSTEDGLDEYGIPLEIDSDDRSVYISLVVDNEALIFIDRTGELNATEISEKATYVGKAKCCNKIYRFRIDNFETNNRIYIFNRNRGTESNSTYILGHIYLLGKLFPTNNRHFKVVAIESFDKRQKNTNHVEFQSFYGFDDSLGGRRLGCYRDNYNRMLEHFYKKEAVSFQECNELAKRRNHRFFGLQDGGICRTGNDESRAKSLGKCPDEKCNNRNNKYLNMGTGGGCITNDLHLTYSLPKIRECGNLPDRKSSNDYSVDGQKGSIRGRINEDAQILKPEIGASCDNNVIDRWVLYEFSILEFPDVSSDAVPDTKYEILHGHVENKESLMKYCPDTTYVEFNSSACSDPISTDSCTETPIKGYIPDLGECKTKTDFVNESKSVFEILQNTKNQMDYLSKINNKSFIENKNHVDNFNTLFSSCMNMANNILSTELSDSVMDDPKTLINKVRSAVIKETNVTDQTISNSGMMLKQSYENLINTGRIILGKFNISNLPCPCQQDDSGLIKCGPC